MGWITGYMQVMWGDGDIYADHDLFWFESSQVVLMQENKDLLAPCCCGNHLSGGTTIQTSKATRLGAKEACRSHGGFKHLSICILMEMNQNPICAK